MLLGHKDLSWRQLRTHTKRAPLFLVRLSLVQTAYGKGTFHSKREKRNSSLNGVTSFTLAPFPSLLNSPQPLHPTPVLSWPRFLVFIYQGLSTQSLVPGTGHSSCPTFAVTKFIPSLCWNALPKKAMARWTQPLTCFWRSPQSRFRPTHLSCRSRPHIWALKAPSLISIGEITLFLQGDDGLFNFFHHNLMNLK